MTLPLNTPLRTAVRDTSGYGGKPHMVEITPVTDRGVYQGAHTYDFRLRPLCQAYRKPDGSKLKKHLNHPPRSVHFTGPEDDVIQNASGVFPDYDPAAESSVCAECVKVYVNGGDGQARVTSEEASKQLETLKADGSNLPTLLKPLNASQRASIKRVVVSDFAALKSNIDVQFEQHKAAKRRELQELLGGGEKERKRLLDKAEKLRTRIMKEQEALRLEMKESGFVPDSRSGYAQFSVNIPTSLKPAEYDRAVNKANEEARELYRLALAVAESEKARVLRLIDLSAVDATVAADLVKVIPTAEDVFAQAMAGATTSDDKKEEANA